jgi:hypothetical protein
MYCTIHDDKRTARLHNNDACGFDVLVYRYDLRAAYGMYRSVVGRPILDTEQSFCMLSPSKGFLSQSALIVTVPRHCHMLDIVLASSYTPPPTCNI